MILLITRLSDAIGWLLPAALVCLGLCERLLMKKWEVAEPMLCSCVYFGRVQQQREASMRKTAGLFLGAAIAVAASIASAQSVEGTIEEMDPVAKSILVDGNVYQMDETTAGTPFEELKVGDKVNITASEEDSGEDESMKPAMMVEKVEE